MAKKDNTTTTRAAIRTRYAGPTNSRGSRIIVTDSRFFDEARQRHTYDWNHALDVNENHAQAAQAWFDKFNDHNATIKGAGLSYDGDYYWTWECGQ